MKWMGLDLPEEMQGDTPIETILLAKVMRADGSIVYREWKSSTLHPMEGLGMATSLSDSFRDMLMKGSRRAE